MLLVVVVIVGSVISSGLGGRVASAMDGAVCRIASTGCEEPAPATEAPGRPPSLHGGVDQPTSLEQLQDAQEQQQQLLNSDDADEQMALQLQLQQLQEMIQLIQQIMQQQQEMATQIISNVR